MMNGYGCAFDECARPVKWIITSLAPAATVSLCAEHFPQGIIPMVAAELGVDPLRLYEAIKRFTDREAARQAKAKAKTSEVKPEPAPEIPGRMGTGQVADNDTESLVFADEGEWMDQPAGDEL